MENIENIHKILGQLVPSGGVLTEIYTVPDGAQANVNLIIVNMGAEDKIRIVLSKAGAVYNVRQCIAYDYIVPINSPPLNFSGIALAPTDVIKVYSLTGTTAFNIDGGTTPYTGPPPPTGFGLFAWGWNSAHGTLGDGTMIDRSSPVQIGDLTDWANINAGYHNTASIKTDGTLWTWGCEFDGGTGQGAGATEKSSPVQVGSETNWANISGSGYGQHFGAAIKTDGSLWVWGHNSHGQLGLGDIITRSSPVQVGNLNNWKSVSCGGSQGETDTGFMAAIKTDGTLWAFGDNSYGQLGDGTRINKSSPVQVGKLTNWKSVSCGNNHVSAIKTDGTLWVWGNNGDGELGQGNIINRSSPVQVGLLNNWKMASCGQWCYTLAIKTDGTLWAFGDNSYGQLGDGTSLNKSSPVQVGLLNLWDIVSCGYRHTAAIKTDGTLWIWGTNNYGELGDLTIVPKSSPVQVGSLDTWVQVSCGYNYTMAISG
jgi:alpha-tubulin suppressor-like RCC1 family protein